MKGAADTARVLKQRPSHLSGVAPRPTSGSETGASAGHAFTAVTKVLPSHERELTDYLTRMGTDIDGATDIRFAKLRLVHFMRWLVVADSAGDAWLVLESNHDGDLDAHLDELLRVGAPGVHQIYRHCAGYPFAEAQALAPSQLAACATFLRQQSVPYAAFHVGTHRQTAERIRRESEIRNAIATYVDEMRHVATWNANDPDGVYERIVRHLDDKGLLEWAQEKQPPRPRSINALWFVPVAIPLLPVLLPFWIVLRIHEAMDVADPPVAAPPGVKDLADREDFQVQNQLSSVTDTKPGLFRQVTLRAVLWAIDLLARYTYNQGSLGGITTIHFARWVLFDHGKRLLFFSNYDGSWESYLGDFVDKAHVGLTAVWSNTRGFPKTRNLIGAGATDEERFKSWTRTHQIPTQLWYSAYPQLTVFNIQQNARICAGLAERPATREAMLDWLQSL